MKIELKGKNFLYANIGDFVILKTPPKGTENLYILARLEDEFDFICVEDGYYWGTGRRSIKELIYLNSEKIVRIIPSRRILLKEFD